MKKIIPFLLVFIVLTWTAVDARPHPKRDKKTLHWSIKRNTATGKHHYMKPGWPRRQHCAGMYRCTPVKISSVRRMAFWKPTKQ